MMELTAFDKSLLNLLQANLPVCSHPYAKLAEQLDTEEQVVLSRLQDLKAAGYLRRIGTFFDSNQLGYKGTLVALKVEPDRMQTVAEAINRLADAYLYVNQPEDEPAFEGQSLSDREHL